MATEQNDVLAATPAPPKLTIRATHRFRRDLVIEQEGNAVNVTMYAPRSLAVRASAGVAMFYAYRQPLTACTVMFWDDDGDAILNIGEFHFQMKREDGHRVVAAFGFSTFTGRPS